MTSGTLAKGRFITVANAQVGWQGDLEGGKEQWGARSELLYKTARSGIASICGEWFVAVHKGPVYTMLDNDETMGGMAPVLGVAASMVAYLAAEANTKDENISVSAYMEFSCQSDEK